MKTERTHDKLYLKEDYKTNPKEYFKMVYKEMEKDWDVLKDKKILDIGCATGDFLHYLRVKMPGAPLYGMDIMEELLLKVDDGIETFCANIADSATLPEEKFDICTMMGVLSIFDNYEQVLDNVLSLLDKKKCLYLFSFLNPENLDVLVKVRNAEKHEVDREETWEAGWNYISKYSISNYCRSRNLSCEFLPFVVDFNIPKHFDDPLRTWTVECGNDLMVINGLQMIQHFYLCKIHS